MKCADKEEDNCELPCSEQTKIASNIRLRYQMEADKQFNPKALDGTLVWLLRIGVITTEKAKMRKTYTLPRNTRDAKTDAAREIIRRAISLKDELKRGKVW